MAKKPPVNKSVETLTHQEAHRKNMARRPAHDDNRGVRIGNQYAPLFRPVHRARDCDETGSHYVQSIPSLTVGVRYGTRLQQLTNPDRQGGDGSGQSRNRFVDSPIGVGANSPITETGNA